jgi:hypothetical protein
VYGVDYLVPEAAARLGALKREVVGHLAAAPDALLVVEEYDKLDCGARGLWRQLLQHPERANITNNRCVVWRAGGRRRRSRQEGGTHPHAPPAALA